MGPKVFLLVGDTESEKISFINHVCDEQFTSPEIGNISEKSKVNLYKIGKSSLLFPDENSDILIIDVISFDDNICSIDNCLILKLIISKLLDIKYEQIDGIIILESLCNHQNSLSSNLHHLERIFGEKVKKTLIIINTKWDQLEGEKYDGEIKFFSELTSKFNSIQCINKSSEADFSENFEKIENFQLVELKNALRSLLPYNILDNFDELNEERRQIVNQLKESDPDRYIVQIVNYEEGQPIECEYIIKYEESEKRNKTEDEIQARALELQKEKGMRQVTGMRYEERTVPYIHQDVTIDDIQPSHVSSLLIFGMPALFEGKRERIVEKIGYRTEYYPVTHTELVPYPLDICIIEARNETINVIKEKVIKEIKFVKVQKESNMKVEAPSDDYYLSKALEILAQRYKARFNN